MNRQDWATAHDARVADLEAEVGGLREWAKAQQERVQALERAVESLEAILRGFAAALDRSHI